MFKCIRELHLVPEVYQFELNTWISPNVVKWSHSLNLLKAKDVYKNDGPQDTQQRVTEYSALSICLFIKLLRLNTRTRGSSVYLIIRLDLRWFNLLNVHCMKSLNCFDIATRCKTNNVSRNLLTSFVCMYKVQWVSTQY